MTEFRFIDDLARRLSEAVPEGVSQAREDIESNLRPILNKTFERMDLVTREQFDAQSAVLERLREKLVDLERQLSELQSKKKPES